jgi:hypothetical protein
LGDSRLARPFSVWSEKISCLGLADISWFSFPLLSEAVLAANAFHSVLTGVSNFHNGEKGASHVERHLHETRVGILFV